MVGETTVAAVLELPLVSELASEAEMELVGESDGCCVRSTLFLRGDEKGRRRAFKLNRFLARTGASAVAAEALSAFEGLDTDAASVTAAIFAVALRLRNCREYNGGSREAEVGMAEAGERRSFASCRF